MEVVICIETLVVVEIIRLGLGVVGLKDQALVKVQSLPVRGRAVDITKI
jgi:hypothetical protein